MSRAKTIPQAVTVHVPFQIVKRGKRKEVVLPPAATTQRKPDETFVKTLARAFRWKRMLDSGAFSTISDLAQRLVCSVWKNWSHLRIKAPGSGLGLLFQPFWPRTCPSFVPRS